MLYRGQSAAKPL